jgi:hypothetical protein
MSDLKLQNLLIYLGVGLLNALAIATAAALAAGTMPGFRDGEFLRPSEDVVVGLLALLVPVLTTWLASNRPRFGSEQLAAEVGAYRDLGYHRADLTVLPKGGRAPDPTRATDHAFPVVLTGDQVQQMTQGVADELEARMRRTKAPATR